MVFKVIRFSLFLALTSTLLWFLMTPRTVGGKSIPPIGHFFNPFSGFWTNAEPISGPRLKDISLPGLKAPVQVKYDDLMVPHIFAQNIEDAVATQGYVMAQNRLWQMDLASRKSGGRLSEILGERTLKLDRNSRRAGMVFAAQNDLSGWANSPETMRMLEAYTRGVNAYVDQLSKADYPIEFKLLHYEPEHWSTMKTALVMEGMAETLCSKEDDLASSAAMAAFGYETFQYLYPEWNPKQQPIIPDTGQWNDMRLLPGPPPETASSTRANSIDTDTRQGSVDPYEIPALYRYREGSNNWALSGSKTASGHPILANDPHLMLNLPSVWFQLQIHTPEQNFYGVTFPGVPGVVIGFNEQAAWGLTNVGHDVADWYKIKWTNAERTKYTLDGEIKEVKLQIEEIKIKGQPTLLDTVRYTVWGPVSFDHEPTNPLYNYAYRWVTHDVPPRSALDVFLGLCKSKNTNDYLNAVAGFDAPAQNFVFATRSGDIAIRSQGRFPVKGKERGRFLQDGSVWLNGWHNFIPEDQIPTLKNPSRGFVFSANQHTTPPEYPYYYLGDFEDNRSRRIYDRLSNMQRATPDSMKTIQLDNFSYRAADALPVMLQYLDRTQLDADGQQMVKDLASWHYYYDADAIAPTIFDAWFDSTYALTFDEMESYRLQKKAMLFPEDWRFIDMMQRDSNSSFFDHKSTDPKETARDIVMLAFKKMQAGFAKKPAQKTVWSTAKGFAIKHLAQIDAFSRNDLKVGGHDSSPNAIQKRFGPSWRMIVDLGDRVTAQGVYPGGQSGNPGSRYYDNMMDAWATGRYFDLLFLADVDESSSKIIATQNFK